MICCLQNEFGSVIDEEVEFLLAIFFWDICKYSATVLCPPQLYGSEWSHRAWEICQSNGTLYHCLSTQEGDFEELCIEPKNISAGFYAKYSRAAKRMYLEPCPSNLYQPSWQWSNLIFKCEREKTVCVSDHTPGQLTCNDGTSLVDRACFCDYKNGYVASIYALGNPQKLRCYIPSVQSSRCTYIPCRDNQELNSAYECVPICDPGMYRPSHDLECVDKPSTSIIGSSTDIMIYNSTTPYHSSKIVTFITKDFKKKKAAAAVSSMTFEKRRNSSNVLVTVFVILAIVVIFVSIVMFICMPKGYYYRRLRNCICKTCCGKEPPEEEEFYPLPQIFSSTSTLPFRTPRSTPAHSPYVTPSQSPKFPRAQLSYMENGGTHFLKVPDHVSALKRTKSVTHEKSNPASLYSGTRRLSKSESSLEIPAMAQLLMLKQSSRSTERIGRCRTAKTRQESPLAKETDNYSPLSADGSTQSLISGVVQQPGLPSSAKNSPYVIKKQLVYIFQNVNNAIVGDHGKMVIQNIGKSTEGADEEDSSEENGDESEGIKLLSKAKKSERNNTSLESSKTNVKHPTPTTISEAMDSLSEQVSDKYTIEDVEHDGHCVYHCVKTATGCKLSIKELRNWVAGYLEEHCNVFKECLLVQRKHHTDSIDNIWTSYLEGVRNEEWGDYFVLVALANIFDIEINVISTRTPNDVLAIKPSSNSRYSIFLGHLTDLSTDRDLHFVILHEKNL